MFPYLVLAAFISLSASARPQPSCVAIPDGLVSWWRGEAGAHDSYGQNDALIYGGVTNSPGMVGSALDFNGVDGYTLAPASATLNVQSFTFEAWIFPHDVTSVREILEYAAPTGSDFGR